MNSGGTLPTLGAGNQLEVISDYLLRLNVVVGGVVVQSRTVTTPPGSPTTGQAWLIPSGADAPWDAWQDLVVVYGNKWLPFGAPREGDTVAVLDEGGRVLRWDGSSWVAANATTDAITASTTQTQGQGALGYGVSRIATCANTNDTVTLPAAVAGKECLLANDGAETLQIFPASGDRIRSLEVDAATTMVAGKAAMFSAVDGVRWIMIVGA